MRRVSSLRLDASLLVLVVAQQRVDNKRAALIFGDSDFWEDVMFLSEERQRERSDKKVMFSRPKNTLRHLLEPQSYH